MNYPIGTSCRHAIELRPGEEKEISLRFAEPGGSFAVALSGADPTAGTAELVFDNLWGAYHMRQFKNEERRWTTLWPDEDGDVHCVVTFGSGKHVNISSDTAVMHSLDLVEVAWTGVELQLVFDELS